MRITQQFDFAESPSEGFMNNPGAEEDEPLSRPPTGAVVLFLLALAAVVAILAAADSALRSTPLSSEVRVRNNSAFPFRQVVVNGVQYGNIKAGESSEYRKLQMAYRYASVRLIAGTHEMQLTPDDYVGEVPLGSGRFTYVLNIIDVDKIDISVEEDSR